MNAVWKTALVIAIVAGCAAGASDDSDAKATDPGPDASTPVGGDDAGHIDDATTDASLSDAATDACTGDDCDPTDPTDPNRAPKSCAAQANAHVSHSTLTYDPMGTDFLLKTFEATVTNSLQRSGNSVVVAVKQGAAGTYVDKFSSGPVLANGVKTSVPVPANLTVKAGDTVRVTTTFDEGSALDPFAPCFMKF